MKKITSRSIARMIFSAVEVEVELSWNGARKVFKDSDKEYFANGVAVARPGRRFKEPGLYMQQFNSCSARTCNPKNVLQSGKL